MNGEKKINRKDWIKNVAIVFLSVMLVLTFFSNTILNYSLPEVATVWIESGSVTSRIRGTGTLTAEDPYKITIQESRVIASVAVKEGDTVEKDQVLFYLEDKESEELEAAEAALREAEKSLDALILAYSTSLLAGEISNQSYQNIQNGNISTNNAYQARIDAAKQKLDNAQATVDSLATQIAIAETTSSTQINKEAELANAQAALESAGANQAEIQGQLANAQASYNALDTVENLNQAITKAMVDADVEELEYKNAKKEFEEASGLVVGDLSTIEDWGIYLDNLVEQYRQENPDTGNNTINTNGTGSTDGTGNSSDTGGTDSSNGKTVEELKNNLQLAYADYLGAQAVIANARKDLDQKLSYESEVNRLTTDYTNATNHYNECKALVERLQAESNNNTAVSKKQVADLTIAKYSAEAARDQAKDELAQLLTDVSSELDLSTQNEGIRMQQEQVAKLREEVEKLIEESQGATIVAPVAGIVTSINKTAGENTTPDEELAVMQPEGKGFSLSFSVTNEQAQKVSVGDPAELQNAWYFTDIEASLTAIRPDPENPGQNRLLVFSVEGDVQAGQSLSLVVGQRSANYDMIVPNSAIREDNNGKFILIVESRNSPLGNRYIATRTDVEILATDEVNSAISAPLYGYEYVITTATKPVEAGQEVRLAEN